MISKHAFMQKAKSIDFTLVQKKITKEDPNIAKIWSLKGARDAIEQYRKFMYLLYKYHNTDYIIVPSIEVDEIWHHHILDTKKYQEDCKILYGFFAHHFPYLGMGGKRSLQKLHKYFQITQNLYFEEFGEYMYEVNF